MENSVQIDFPLDKIPLEQLKLYPAEYQFRLNQGESGEVETHKIKGDKWEPLLHGVPVYVHKRRDSAGNWEYAVVDGHHRVNFAKRLAESGKLPPDFKLDAYILEEEKGINAETAKLMLAFKDIARGTNNVVEEAIVLKEARENPYVRQNFLPSIDMSVGNLNLAVKFSGISNRAMDMLKSGEVPVEAAKHVVEKIPHDHKKQERVFAIISTKLKQDYPNYTPDSNLAALLASKSNDNQQLNLNHDKNPEDKNPETQSWLERMQARNSNGKARQITI